MRKKLKMMMLLSTLLLAVPLAVGAQTVSGQFINTPLKTVLVQIESQSGYTFMFRNEDISSAPAVSASFEDVPLTVALDKVLGSNFSYQVKGKNISITKKTTPVQHQPQISEEAQPKMINVTGKAVDKNGEPVIGAAITVKGKPSLGGCITDLDGNFAFRVPEGSTLVTTCLNYVQVEFVASETPRNIVLGEDAEMIEETVVIGYGIQKKESVVGAISSVSSSTLANSGATEISSALSGKVSGLLSYSKAASGAPGENSESFLIRGLTSWNGNAPLVMVDGIERDMSSVSPHEVESISVLKDASATAIYGAKGANGVILVTTKTGQKGAPSFHVNAEYGISDPVMLPEHIDAYTTASMANVAYQNMGSFGSMYTDQELQYFKDGTNPLRYPDVNFYDLLLKDFSTSYNSDMSLSGGNDKVKYYMGASYVHEGSIVNDVLESVDKGYSSDRITYRLNIDYNITKTTKISIKAGGSLKDLQGPITNSGHSSPENSQTVFGGMYRASTIAYPAYYPDYALELYPDPDYPDEQGARVGGQQGYRVTNPYWRMMNPGYVRRETNNNNLDFILKQNLNFITEGLSIGGKAGLNTTYSVMKERCYRENQIWDIDWDGVDSGVDNPWVSDVATYFVYNMKPYGVSSSNSASGSNYVFYLEGSVDYARKFANAHNVTGLLLYNQRQYNSGSSFPKKNQSFVGRATYDYKGKYLFEVNAGVTGSEQFAPSNRFGFFPSVAVGYVVSKEEWWKNAMPWWSNFKVRFSDGKVGSDNSTADWLYYTYWSRKSGYIVEGAAANENARWETSVKKDLGLEFGFLDNSILFNVDLYDEQRKDILTSPVVSVFVATSFKDINSGSVKKHGVDFELKYRKAFSNSLSIELGGMFGLSENRITHYEDLPYMPEYQKQTGTQYGTMRYGESLVDDNYFTTIDEIHGYSTYTTNWGGNVVPGVYKFLDYDRNGKIDTDDLHTIKGSLYAPGVYSLSVGLGYKGFSFSMLGTGTIGKYMNVAGSGLVPFATEELVVHEMATDYWTPTNHDASAPVTLFSNLMYSWGGGTIAYDNDGYYLGINEYTWRKSDYFLLKEARLGYKFDLTKHRLPAVKGITVSLIGNNLYLVSPFTDINPIGTHGASAIYPQMRTIKLGVSFDF